MRGSSRPPQHDTEPHPVDDQEEHERHMEGAIATLADHVDFLRI